MELAKITRRAIGPDGKTAGTYDEDPKLNSMIYEVEFPDSMVKEYLANVIAQNLLSQIDSEGFSNTVFDSIIDYAKDETALTKKNRFIVTKHSRRKLRKSTVGWKLLVKWKDGSKSWVPLKGIKESNPVDVAEFSKAREIDDEPAFV